MHKNEISMKMLLVDDEFHEIKNYFVMSVAFEFSCELMATDSEYQIINFMWLSTDFFFQSSA